MSLLNLLRWGSGEAGKRRKLAAKARRRAAKFTCPGVWQQDGDFVRRAYPSYDAYVAHQRSKLAGHLSQLNDTLGQDLAEFERRFRSCAPLQEAQSVLCLGARLGSEVRALHALGFFAIGIDLNPGADNNYVLPGDFHRLVFADGSIDAVYTNALDHAFDVERVANEVARVLKLDGLFVVDMLLGLELGYVPGDFEAIVWREPRVLVNRLCGDGRFVVVGARDLGPLRRATWQQVVLRKADFCQTRPGKVA